MDSQFLGQRLDRALVRILADRGEPYNRSQLQQAFAAKQVRVAGKAAKPARKVDRSFVVELTLPPIRQEPHPRKEALALDLVFEDEYLLVVNKAAGMVVHGGPGHYSGTLVNAVLNYLNLEPDELPTLPGNDMSRPGIVHRLDRKTSGLLVVVKNAEVLHALAKQFREHSIQRKYAGVVYGEPRWTKRYVETPHGRDPKDHRRFSPNPGGLRQARTHVWVRQRFHQATLLGFRLETGRTHQIRMHARYLGHSIVGDDLYGRRSDHSYMRVRQLIQNFPRYALHAQTLGFFHPITKENVSFESRLPIAMQQLIEGLTPLG